MKKPAMLSAAGGLSAVIIASNEEHDLPKALESVLGLADEVVVLVGAESQDGTETIAREAGAKVMLRAFDTYQGQKQAALNAASMRWVLSLDADERVTPGLKEEIRETLSRPHEGIAGYEIPFEVFFMGRRLKHGGLGREKHLRLFLRERGRFVGGGLHEGISLSGGTCRLKTAIQHIPYHDLAEYLSKLDRYTTLAAQKRFAQGRRFRLWHHLILPAEFFLRSVLKLGFLDGQAGLAWAGLSAFHSWLKYVKLKELE